jgi:glycerol-3-phosphate dehydrogenase
LYASRARTVKARGRRWYTDAASPMSHPELDCLIIGGGVVGLAAGAELAAAGYSVAIAERHRRAGMETSTHNSGVIHAGLHYPAGSLKAQLCVDGAARMYQWCSANRVPCDRCGKLVVATRQSEIEELEALRARGTANGAGGLEIVDQAFISTREPQVHAVAALWSPDTGRVDATTLVGSLLREAQRYGAIFLYDSTVVGGSAGQGLFSVRLQRETLLTRSVVNAAGLHADDVSAALGGERYRIYPCRGEYAELKPARRAWVNGLVYPLPHPSGHGLGVHLTRTTDGNVLLGPTSRFQERKDDYEDNRVNLESFVDSARPFLPALTIDDVTYGGSGIRAKLHPPEDSFADFLIRHDAHHPRLVHAAGIDSPGLTSCLSIARRITALVQAIID